MSAGSFSAALTALKNGDFVRRACWKDEFVMMVQPAHVPTEKMGNIKMREIIEDFPYASMFDPGFLRKVDMFNATMTSGWMPSPGDLMAEDWIIYDMEDIEMSKLEWELEKAMRCHADVTYDSLARLIISQLEAMNIPIDEDDSLDFKQRADDREHLIVLAGPDYRGLTITTEDGAYSVNHSGPVPGRAGGATMVGAGKLWVEIQTVLGEVGRSNMSPRKFHRTLISVEVLSEDPIPDMPLEDIVSTMNNGDYVGTWDTVNQAEVNAKQAVQVLHALGSEPGFFNLTEEGRDAE